MIVILAFLFRFVSYRDNGAIIFVIDCEVVVEALDYLSPDVAYVFQDGLIVWRADWQVRERPLGQIGHVRIRLVQVRPAAWQTLLRSCRRLRVNDDDKARENHEDVENYNCVHFVEQIRLFELLIYILLFVVVVVVVAFSLLTNSLFFFIFHYHLSLSRFRRR